MIRHPLYPCLFNGPTHATAGPETNSSKLMVPLSLQARQARDIFFRVGCCGVRMALSCTSLLDDMTNFGHLYDQRTFLNVKNIKNTIERVCNHAYVFLKARQQISKKQAPNNHVVIIEKELAPISSEPVTMIFALAIWHKMKISAKIEYIS